MNTRIILKTVAAFALAINVGSASAVNFPATGGNRNIADPAAWGGTPPASTDDVTFTQGGTFTASDNVSFRSVTVAAPKNNTLFDFRANNAKLTLSGGSGVYGLTFSANSLQRIYLQGGVWDFNGAMLRNGHDSVEFGADHLNMILDGGVIVTNVSTFYWAKHAQATSGHYNTCNIQGGAKV